MSRRSLSRTPFDSYSFRAFTIAVIATIIQGINIVPGLFAPAEDRVYGRNSPIGAKYKYEEAQPMSSIRAFH